MSKANVRSMSEAKLHKLVETGELGSAEARQELKRREEKREAREMNERIRKVMKGTGQSREAAVQAIREADEKGLVLASEFFL